MLQSPGKASSSRSFSRVIEMTVCGLKVGEHLTMFSFSNMCNAIISSSVCDESSFFPLCLAISTVKVMPLRLATLSATALNTSLWYGLSSHNIYLSLHPSPTAKSQTPRYKGQTRTQ